MLESNSRKAIKGISSQSFVTIILGFIEILSFSIMSRLLTPEDFGYFAAVTAITTVFASFSETGIGSALIQKKEINDNYINNAFTLSFLFGCFISLLLFFLSGVLARIVADYSLKTPIMLMSATLLCNCITSVNTSLMIRQLQFIRVGSINLLSLFISTLIAVILAIKGFGYYAILVKVVLSSVLTLAFSFFFLNVRYRLELDIQSFKSIFRFSGWLMASVFFRNFAQQIDRLLMGRLLSVEALGIYNRPKEFINQISTKLNGIFDTALFPILSSIQDNKTSLQNAYKTSFYYLNIVAMLLAIVFIFNHELIIRIFFGEQWLSTKVIFIILSVALLFNIDGRLSDCYFRSLGLTKDQFFFRILELVIKVIGLLIGAHWEIIGVAISIVTSNLIMILIKTFYIAGRIDISALQTVSIILSSWQFAIIELPLLIIVYLLSPHTVVGNLIIAFFTLFITCLLFFFFPSAVGSNYRDVAYPRVIGYIKQTIARFLKRI